jgi:ABC-type nickel/cobalt efflux system permease component RcnA
VRRNAPNVFRLANNLTVEVEDRGKDHQHRSDRGERAVDGAAEKRHQDPEHEIPAAVDAAHEVVVQRLRNRLPARPVAAVFVCIGLKQCTTMYGQLETRRRRTKEALYQNDDSGRER